MPGIPIGGIPVGGPGCIPDIPVGCPGGAPIIGAFGGPGGDCAVDGGPPIMGLEGMAR